MDGPTDPDTTGQDGQQLAPLQFKNITTLNNIKYLRTSSGIGEIR